MKKKVERKTWKVKLDDHLLGHGSNLTTHRLIELEAKKEKRRVILSVHRRIESEFPSEANGVTYRNKGIVKRCRVQVERRANIRTNARTMKPRPATH